MLGTERELSERELKSPGTQCGAPCAVSQSCVLRTSLAWSLDEQSMWVTCGAQTQARPRLHGPLDGMLWSWFLEVGEGRGPLCFKQ